MADERKNHFRIWVAARSLGMKATAMVVEFSVLSGFVRALENRDVHKSLKCYFCGVNRV